MKYKIGDKVRVRIDLVPYEKYGSLTFLSGKMSKCAGQICTIKEVLGDEKYYVSENPFAWSEEMLEPAAPTLSEVKDGKINCIVHTRTQEEANILCEELGSDSGWHRPANECWQYYKKDTWYIIQNGLVHQFGNEDCRLGHPLIPTCEFSDLFATGGVVSIHDLPTSEWYNPMRLTFKNGSSIEALSKATDAVRGNLKPVWIDKIELPTATETKEQIERVCRELEDFAHKFYAHKEEKKMPTKFTFYVTEGTRPDKNPDGDGKGVIPTMTTIVEANNYSRTAPVGIATCDKADYDMRQGVLEALANMYCDGNFDKVYNKAVKRNKLADEINRTCIYCGKIFDTAEERVEHEAWHVERKKARRERYLIRKRAKEIAFEEQAQKMAKEMIKEGK